MTEKPMQKGRTSADTRPVLLLSWRQQAHEKGLARNSEPERGWDYHAGGVTVARVRPLTRERQTVGWYFYGSDASRGVPVENTAHAGVSTPEEAMSQAERHFLKHTGATHRVLMRRPLGMGKPATFDDKTTQARKEER